MSRRTARSLSGNRHATAIVVLTALVALVSLIALAVFLFTFKIA